MIGQTISHYRILKKLGEGGMGKVYLADDIKLDRKVAMKFLPKEMTVDPDANRRFKREAHTVAQLNHPNIITIHEIDEVQGKKYIVSEYVSEGTLKEKLKVLMEQTDELQKLRDILVIALQIGRGLQKAHEAGIIHRDIKPDNILVDSDGQVKIMDFGLARLSSATSKLTKDQTTTGTAQYMAPEQIMAGDIDQRADIWSFGVVLFEMITGELPFKEEFLQALFYSIINVTPPSLAEQSSLFPAGLGKIVSKCLEKEANDRYPTMTELLADLKLAKHKLTKGTDPIKGTGIFFPFLRRRKKRILPVLFLIPVILFTLIPNPGRQALKGLLFDPKLPARKYVAVLPLVSSNKNPIQKIYCKGTTARIIQKLIGLEQFQKEMWVIPISELLKSGAKDIQKTSKSSCVTLILTGKVQMNDDKVNYELNLLNAKTWKKLRTKTLSNHITNLSGLQDGIIRELVEMLDMEWGTKLEKMLTAGGTSLPGAYRLYLQGMGFLMEHKNKDNIDQAIKMFSQAIEQDNSYGEAYASLGNAYLSMYRLTKEKNWLEKAESYCNRALDINKELYTVHLIKGYIHQEKGKYENAIGDFQKALDLNPEYFQAGMEIAKTFDNNLRENNKAEEAFKKAITIRDEYWRGYKYLGYFYFKANRYPEAEKEYLKVIDLNPADIWTYKGLFGIYNKRTDDISSRKARELFEKSKQFGADGDIYSNMGTNLFYQKKYIEAMEMYLEAIKLRGNSTRKFMIWGNLGDSYRLIQGNEKEAQKAYQNAIRLVQKRLSEVPDDAVMHSSLALYLSKLGKQDQAIIEMNKALELDPRLIFVLQNSVVVSELSGQRNKALKCLAEIIKRHGALGELTQNPFLTELWKDPEYVKILTPEENHEGKNK